MTTFYPPDVPGVGAVLNGQLVITFPGTPYRRYIRRIGGIMTSAANSQVNIYIGQIASPCLIATNIYGANQGWAPVNPAPVPAGSPIYVVFPNAVPGVDSASATLQATGEMYG